MNKPIKKILITGGNGLIGQALTQQLQAQGHDVRWLVRRPVQGNLEMFRWSIEENFIDPKAFEGLNCIIHLAGENVGAARWTKKRKKEILESRINTSALLVKYIQDSGCKIETFIAASAVGYYGSDLSHQPKTESSENGKDFLAEVTRKWENILLPLNQLVDRFITFRIGVVLTKSGGALEKLSLPIKFYAGSALGSGTQMVSWIQIEDLLSMFLHAIDHENVKGVFNAVAPHPITNLDLTIAIAKKLKRPLLLPNIPSIALKLILGEMADMVLLGSFASCEKILSAGFKFKYPDLESALNSTL